MCNVMETEWRGVQEGNVGQEVNIIWSFILQIKLPETAKNKRKQGKWQMVGICLIAIWE